LKEKIMFRLIIVLLISLLTTPAFAIETPKTDDQKTLYSIGAYQSRQLAMFSFTPVEYEKVLQGFADSAHGKKPVVDVDKYGKKVQEFAQARRAAKDAKLEDKNTLYSIGSFQARQLAMFNFTRTEYEMVLQGFADAAHGKKLVVAVENYSKKVQELAQARRATKGSKPVDAGTEFLNKAASEKGAVKTSSGLVFQSRREGDGATPSATDTISMHYRGTLINGEEFDNTINLRKPAVFKLDSVIKCWAEGLQKMKAGGSAKLVCPPELAYGKQGVDSVIPPNSVLIFEIELLEVTK
jgi:FKBP-type peptidyl-prolyl cis-trans isomerase FkpA